MESHEEDDDYLKELLDRFERSLEREGSAFFDSDEMEDIIFHYFNKPDLANAKKAIDQAIKHFPLDINFQIFKAQYLLNKGKSENALKHLNFLNDTHPDNPDVMLTRASVLSNLNRHEEAIAEMLKSITLVDEGKDDILTNIAYEYQILNNFPKAVEYFQKALKNNGDHENLLYELGFCYELGQLNEEAVAFFSSEVDKDPYSYIAWFNLGIAYNNLELYEKAIDSFDYVIAIEPEFLSAYFSKAQTYEQMEMHQFAINVYKQALEFDKTDSMTYYYIGDCYANLEKFELAIEYYRKSINIERNFANAWLGLGMCFAETGNHTEALAHIKEAIKLDPEEGEFYIVLAETQLALLLVADAIRSYKKAAEIDPYHPELWLGYSDIYARFKKDYKKALELIEDGLFYQLDSSELMYRRVAYLLESGQHKEALRELYIALAIDFDSHDQLFEYSEKAKNSPQILMAIESFKNQDYPL